MTHEFQIHFQIFDAVFTLETDKSTPEYRCVHACIWNNSHSYEGVRLVPYPWWEPSQTERDVKGVVRTRWINLSQVGRLVNIHDTFKYSAERHRLLKKPTKYCTWYNRYLLFIHCNLQMKEQCRIDNAERVNMLNIWFRDKVETIPIETPLQEITFLKWMSSCIPEERRYSSGINHK